MHASPHLRPAAAFAAALARLFDALYPPRCVARDCGVRGSWLCADCRARVVPVPLPRCDRCGMPCLVGERCAACQHHPPPYARAVAVGAYAGVLRDAVRALKYRGVRGVAAPLGQMVAASLQDPLPDALVVPVPPPPRRAVTRGIDHAGLIAQATARAMGRVPRLDALVRTRPTRCQVGLEPAQRLRNVEGAFAASAALDGRTVILVDDVMTTGATAAACAGALLAGGAASVVVCTVARTL